MPVITRTFIISTEVTKCVRPGLPVRSWRASCPPPRLLLQVQFRKPGKGITRPDAQDRRPSSAKPSSRPSSSGPLQVESERTSRPSPQSCADAPVDNQPQGPGQLRPMPAFSPQRPCQPRGCPHPSQGRRRETELRRGAPRAQAGGGGTGAPIRPALPLLPQLLRAVRCWREGDQLWAGERTGVSEEGFGRPHWTLPL